MIHPKRSIPKRSASSASLATTAWIVVFICSLASSSAEGLEFDIRLTDPAATHSADPDQARLASVVEAAGRRWSNLIEDAHGIQLDIGYGNLVELCSETPAGASACGYVEATADDRVTRASIYFSNNANWYYDATPDSDDEFDFETTLFRDLVPPAFPIGTQFTHFHGFAFEPVLEVGYVGMSNVGSLVETDDLLSVAMREIGFLLGVTSQLPASVNEYQPDGDFDFPQQMIGGVGMAAATIEQGGNVGLVNPLPLLSYQAPAKGTRRLPTATDVLALAALGWNEIHLQRNYLLSRSSGDFHDDASWAGGRTPASDDVARLVSGRDVWLSEDAQLRELVLANSNLDLKERQLLVVHDVLLEGGDTTRLQVGNLGELTARRIDVRGSTIEMDDGRLNAERISIKDGSLFDGTGVVVVSDRLQIDSTSRLHVLLDLDAGADAPLDIQGTLVVEGAILSTRVSSPTQLQRNDTRRTAVVSTPVETVIGDFSTWQLEREGEVVVLDGVQQNHIDDGYFVRLDYGELGIDMIDYLAVAGDANGDGFFDSTDLLTVLQIGEYEDELVGNSDWTDGDWNSDGEFNSTDFITALQAGFYQAERVGVEQVPEPVLGNLLPAFALVLISLRKASQR